MRNLTSEYIEIIEDLLVRIPVVAETWHCSIAGSGFGLTAEYEAIMTSVIVIMERLYGSGSVNHRRAVHFYSEGHLHAFNQTIGLLKETKKIIMSGLINSIESHAMFEVEHDFLTSAIRLNNEGHKDAAAVLASIVLEDALKRLAVKVGMEDLQNDEMSSVASKLLAKKKIEKSTHNSILSFRSLRNAALHAQWHEVSRESVDQLLAFLPSFLQRVIGNN